MSTYNGTPYTTNGTGAATRIKTINGVSLVRRRLTKKQRAILAADVIDGLIRLEPTQRQAAEIFGVSVAYVNAALRLSPAKRDAILAGRDTTSFVDLVNRPHAVPAISKASLIAIAHHAPDRLWDALEAAETAVAAA